MWRSTPAQHFRALIGQAGIRSVLHYVDLGRPEDAGEAEACWEALVEIAPTRLLGEGPLGERRIVPITGGHFAGPRIRGRVLPGGADRQLIRRDGVKRLEALYEIEAEDGAVITVLNRVVIAPPQLRDPARLAPAIKLGFQLGPIRGRHARPLRLHHMGR